MVYTIYRQERILFYYHQGKKAPTICHLLRKEGIFISRSGISYFLNKYVEMGAIGRRYGSGRPTKISLEVIQIVEAQMQIDDETTATQLQKILSNKGYPFLFEQSSDQGTNWGGLFVAVPTVN
jgi:transposase